MKRRAGALPAAAVAASDLRRVIARRSPRLAGAFLGICLFTIVLYLRPNDLLPIGNFPVAKIVAIFAILAFVIGQLGGGRPLSLICPELKYLVGLMPLMLASVALALNPDIAFEYFANGWFNAFVIFTIMINAVNSFRRLRLLLTITTACGTVIAVGTVRGYLQGVVLVEGYRARGFVGGIFGNPNDLALALNILIPLSVGLALISRNVLAKLFHLGCALAMTAAMAVTYSRSGFVAFVAMAGYLIVTLDRYYPGIKRVVLLGVLVMVPLLLSGEYGTRVMSIVDSSLDRTGSSGARWDLLVRAGDVAGLNPKVWLVGVGPGNFDIVSIRRAVTHNAYLQVFTEVGLPAAILYVMFIVSSIRGPQKILVALRQTPGSTPVLLTAVAIQSSLIAYAVGSFFASVAYLWYVYYAAGFAVALRQIVTPALAPARSST